MSKPDEIEIAAARQRGQRHGHRVIHQLGDYEGLRERIAKQREHFDEMERAALFRAESELATREVLDEWLAAHPAKEN